MSLAALLQPMFRAVTLEALGRNAMMKKPKVRRSVPGLPDSEYAAIARLDLGIDFITRLEKRYRIKISAHDRRRICNALAIYADAAFDRPDYDRQEQISEQAVASALDRLFSVLAKQRKYAVPDPRRRGYEYFVLYSQRAYTSAESQQRAEAFFGGRELGDPGLCRDVFDQYFDERQASYSSLGDRQGWLEVLLREIRHQLGHSPLHINKRGPKGKAKYRTFVIYELANVFERSGGTVKAYKNSTTGKIEGDFIRFVAAILKICPPAFRRYLGTGIDEAIVKWCQSGRKAPSEGLMSVG